MKKLIVLFILYGLIIFLAASANAELIGNFEFTGVASPTYQQTNGIFTFAESGAEYPMYGESETTGGYGTEGNDIIWSLWEITGSGYMGTLNKITLDLEDSGFVLDISRHDSNGEFVEYLIQSGSFQVLDYDPLNDIADIFATGRLDDYGIYYNAVETLSSEVDMQMDVLDTINQGAIREYSMHVSDSTEKLEVVANWGGREMLLEVFDPSGALYTSEQGTNPPIKIEVLDPEAGEWTYSLNAIDVPHEYYPVALMAGTSTPVPIPTAACLLGSGLIGLVGIRKKFRTA